MTGKVLQVVQFVHPGLEYQRSEHVGGREIRFSWMGWNQGMSKHDRKFMLARRSLLEWNTARDHRSPQSSSGANGKAPPCSGSSMGLQADRCPLSSTLRSDRLSPWTDHAVRVRDLVCRPRPR
jgi:hypothetical protein